MAYGFDPHYSAEDPFGAAYCAVVTSVAKLVAAGASTENCWLTFQEYFEKLGSDPVRWGKPLAALLGALRAQLGLRLAAIGGKDSMSGTFENITVPPTLVSFAIAADKAGNIISPEFKKPGLKACFPAGETGRKRSSRSGLSSRQFCACNAPDTRRQRAFLMGSR